MSRGIYVVVACDQIPKVFQNQVKHWPGSSHAVGIWQTAQLTLSSPEQEIGVCAPGSPLRPPQRGQAVPADGGAACRGPLGCRLPGTPGEATLEENNPEHGGALGWRGGLSESHPLKLDVPYVCRQHRPH